MRTSSRSRHRRSRAQSVQQRRQERPISLVESHPRVGQLAYQYGGLMAQGDSDGLGWPRPDGLIRLHRSGRASGVTV